MSEQTATLNTQAAKPTFILSTDSLSGYGLDLIFEVAKNVGFDGIDLALWKNFDARNVDYVKRLSTKYSLPVQVIQTSANLNAKEINQALDLAAALGTKVIAINAPTFFDFSTYNFIVDNLPKLKKENPDIKFTIINPIQSTIFALPVPKFRFTSIVEIIKTQGCSLGLDIANLDENVLEGEFMRKISNFIPHVSVVYFSDRNRTGEGHLIPGEGVLKLTTILKKFKENSYMGPFSLKIKLDKKELADSEKVEIVLKKCRTFHRDYFENITKEG